MGIDSKTIAVNVPMPESETSNAQRTLAKIQVYVVESPEDYELAAADLKAIKAQWKRIDEARKNLKRPIDQAAKQLQEFFIPSLTALSRAEDMLKRKMVDYDNAAQAKRRAMQADAEQRASKERQKLQERAQKAASNGDEDKAAELQQRAEMVVAPVHQAVTPKVAGITTSEVWLFEVRDPALVPREYCSPDPKKIRMAVDALRGEARIGGVYVYRDTRIASRSA